MKGKYDLFYSIPVHFSYEIIPDFNQLSHIIMSQYPAVVTLQLFMKYDTRHQSCCFDIAASVNDTLYQIPPLLEVKSPRIPLDSDACVTYYHLTVTHVSHITT